mmetsp:Transcript_9839/g.19240  ORF Transcript_9839/g.19240 Transcript_9839/m.19240 type:complete len:92 (+) Transcript_9839:353-628(+)
MSAVRDAHIASSRLLEELWYITGHSMLKMRKYNPLLRMSREDARHTPRFQVGNVAKEEASFSSIERKNDGKKVLCSKASRGCEATIEQNPR